MVTTGAPVGTTVPGAGGGALPSPPPQAIRNALAAATAVAARKRDNSGWFMVVNPVGVVDAIGCTRSDAVRRPGVASEVMAKALKALSQVCGRFVLLDKCVGVLAYP
jgi:hypothetical protein